MGIGEEKMKNKYRYDNIIYSRKSLLNQLRGEALRKMCNQDSEDWHRLMMLHVATIRFIEWHVRGDVPTLVPTGWGDGNE